MILADIWLICQQLILYFQLSLVKPRYADCFLGGGLREEGPPMSVRRAVVSPREVGGELAGQLLYQAQIQWVVVYHTWLWWGGLCAIPSEDFVRICAKFVAWVVFVLCLVLRLGVRGLKLTRLWPGLRRKCLQDVLLLRQVCEYLSN